MKSQTNNSSKGKAKAAKSSEDYGMEQSKLMKLFEEELRDIYWVEKALTKAIPKMIKNATSEELVEALESHLEETEAQVEKVQEVFESLGKSARAKKCEAMEGIIKEAQEMMDSCDEGAMCDAAIISSAQKVEHYEIASYGTLKTFAQILGLQDISKILDEILNEEKAADEKLTEVAESTVNIQAAAE